MKKLIALVLTLAMVFAFAAPAFAEEPVTMTLALRGGTYADVIEGCLEQFGAENNVKFEVLKLEEADLKSKIALDSINAEGAYDLCMVDGSWMAEFASNEMLANLSAMGYSFDEDVIPATTAISYWDGNIYLAPYYGNVTVLLYNKELVTAAGYTGDTIGSIDDILAICKAAQAAGKKGFIARGDSANNFVVDFMPIMLSFGAQFLDADNKPTVNTEEFKAAMNCYLELLATGDLEKKDDLIASVDTGAGAMGVGWPGWYQPSPEKAADYTAITGKVSADSTAFNANVYGVWTIGVPANAKNPELSLKLLQYLMDKDVQLATVDKGGVPCRYSSLQNEEVLAKYPQYAVVCKALEGGVYRPVIEEWGEFYTILGTEMDNIINGVKTVDAGLADAQKLLEDLMG